jgi:tRNA A-37 threonylcarbamoyl transferase component Bud32
LQTFTTTTQLYDSFINDVAPLPVFDMIPNRVSDRIVKELWEKIRPYALKQMDLSIENNIQRFFEKIMPLLLESTSIKFIPKPQLFTPRFVPDGALIRKAVDTPGWGDVIMPMELKRPILKKMAAGQSIGYLGEVLKRKRDDRVEGYCVAIVYNSIQFFHMKETENRYTPQLDFLKGLSTKRSKPSEGFAGFVGLIHSAPKQLGFVWKDSVKIGNEDVPVIRQLGRGAYGEVYHVTYRDAEYAIKIPLKNNMQSNELIYGERKVMYSLIEQLKRKKSDLFLPDIMIFPEPELRYYLFMKDIGIPLATRIEQEKLNNEANFFNFSFQCFRQLIEAFESLHELGYYHGDVRPHNMIYIESEKKVLLIDFAYSGQIKHPSFTLACPFPYLPRRLYGSRGMHIQYAARDDLESLAYSMYHMITEKIPWIKLESSSLELADKMLEARELCMAGEDEHYPENLKDFYNFVQTLEVSDEINYQEFIALFQ